MVTAGVYVELPHVLFPWKVARFPETITLNGERVNFTHFLFFLILKIFSLHITFFEFFPTILHKDY